MTEQELNEKYTPLVASTGIYEFMGIAPMNYSPHTFKLGRLHLEHAKEHHDGKLGDATLNAIPCADPNCRLPYADHTHKYNS